MIVWHGDAFLKHFRESMRDPLAESAVVAQRSVRQMLNRRQSNRTSGKGSSPPGQPPAKMTGALGRSIQIDSSDLRDKVPSVRVGTSLVYAAIHEFGGIIRAKRVPRLVFKIGGELVMVKSVRMPKRPYMRPGFKAAERKVRRILNAGANKAAKTFRR